MAEELGHGHCEDVPDGDLRVLHVAVRNPGVSGDDSPRIVEMSDVVRTEPAEGEGVAWHSRATSHSTGPLSVVRGRRRNVPHEDGPQVTDVDAEFESGSAGENVHVALDEPALDKPRPLG